MSHGKIRRRIRNTIIGAGLFTSVGGGIKTAVDSSELSDIKKLSPSEWRTRAIEDKNNDIETDLNIVEGGGLAMGVGGADAVRSHVQRTSDKDKQDEPEQRGR